VVARAKPYVVNLVSEMDEAMLRRQEPETELEFVYSGEPVEADWHVVYDRIEEIVVPNHSSRCVFMVGEPPEIRKYDTSVLSQYGSVISAPFGYMKGLTNVTPAAGLLPWRVGIAIERNAPRVTLTRQDFMSLAAPTSDTVSVVTSQKTISKEQVQRLKLIDYLAARIPEMQVFGRDTNMVDDKADALRASKYHLALENCQQPGFWTEKLSDPILMENVTFYSGNNGWEADFARGGGILGLDIRNFVAVYETIRKCLDSDYYSQVRTSLVANKVRVMKSRNLHSAIEYSLSNSSFLDNSRPRETFFPRHKTRERLFSARRCRRASHLSKLKWTSLIAKLDI